MTLKEYLYVDSRRLDSYFEQFSSHVAYDKLPVWTSSLSLTGPSAEVEQVRVGRPVTRHEKIEQFFKYLEKQKLMSTIRPQFTDANLPEGCHASDLRPFCHETIVARRLFIPPNGSASERTRGIFMWVTEEDYGAPLYLIEDFRPNDLEHIQTHSSYHLISVFRDNLRIEVENTVLGDGTNKWHSFFNNESFADILGALGAEVGHPRGISALYRVRDIWLDMTTSVRSGGKLPDVFGYPIVISEA